MGNRPKIPWLGFLTDIGLWALVISEVGHDFTVFTLVNNFPKYLSDVLHYDLAENSLASSLPYLCQWIGGLIAGPLVDYTIKKKCITILASRRLVTSMGSVLPATFVLIGGYMGCNGPLVITMFAINLFFKGTVYAAMKVNHLDMSVHFAGILMAISNGLGALSGYVSPEVINVLAPNNTLEEWQNVFWVVWGAAFFSNLFYIFFSVAERRKWDYPPEEIDQYNKLQDEKKAAKEKKKQDKLEKKKKKAQDDAGPSA
ncbi:membrane transporter [Oryctes borbonicus]|uniref:Membrane transporter n=1 Tax=Oryctes borbonicus TaxID=1629725 RepID=A0A0T6AT16_9SCAR|nr:membrane transporter [Oryctes borbonicus]